MGSTRNCKRNSTSSAFGSKALSAFWRGATLARLTAVSVFAIRHIISTNSTKKQWHRVVHRGAKPAPRKSAPSIGTGRGYETFGGKVFVLPVLGGELSALSARQKGTGLVHLVNVPLQAQPATISYTGFGGRFDDYDYPWGMN